MGTVISHIFPDNSERPIAFASHTLTAAKQNYAQLEKEALALIFGVQKFHRYLYGRKFTLITDHKPLTTILGPKKGIPSLAAARLQRWAILLSAYDYNIRYKCTTEHGNADGLLRLPLPPLQTVTTFNIGQVQALPVTFQDIRSTRCDPTLCKVYRYVLDGWPSHVPDELKRYKNRETELSTENGCLMWGIRVIIPQTLHSQVLKSLHANHPGVTRMKTIALVDKDIEELGNLVKQTNQSNSSSTPSLGLARYTMETYPCRFCWTFQGHTFFIAVDAYSKWPEVVQQPQ